MLAMDPRVANAVWVAVEGHLPPRPPDTHPLGCHRPRIPDRDCFDGILIRLVTGCSWDVAARLCKASETTLRDRRTEWLQAGVFDNLVEESIAAYDRIIGLELSELRVMHATGRDDARREQRGGGLHVLRVNLEASLEARKQLVLHARVHVRRDQFVKLCSRLGRERQDRHPATATKTESGVQTELVSQMILESLPRIRAHGLDTHLGSTGTTHCPHLNTFRTKGKAAVVLVPDCKGKGREGLDVVPRKRLLAIPPVDDVAKLAELGEWSQIDMNIPLRADRATLPDVSQ